MFIPTFFIIATAIISLFTLVNAHPTNAKLAVTEPRSLLGRQYRDVRGRHSLAADISPRRFDVVVERPEPITRSDRFYAIQRRRAEIGARNEQLPDHGENLLSNQSFNPPALQTQIPILSSSPSPTHSDPNTSVTLLSNSTRPAHVHGKHFKGKNAEGSQREVKA